MYDDFFFPYEKAKLWTGNLVWLSLSNFFLYASLYMMLPVLPLWMVRHCGCSYAEAGMAVAVFGLGMYVPGVFHSYLIDAFRRKTVALLSALLLIAIGWTYPWVSAVGMIGWLRVVQGALFGVATMATGSTLVIDVTASRRRTDANISFAWTGRLGMALGLALGVYIYPYWDFMYVVYASVALGGLAVVLLTALKIPFRAPLHPSIVSLDRFLLPRTFWPGLNLVLIAFTFGMLMAHIYNELFYVCMLIGFIVAMLLSRYVLFRTSGRSEVELGQAAMVTGLLLLDFSNVLMTSYIAAFLIGVGGAVSVSRFFIKMISLPMHCERGTGNNTYQLVWETGILAGFLFENLWAEGHPDTIYRIGIALSVGVLLMYETFTHPWYYKKMEEKQ